MLASGRLKQRPLQPKSPILLRSSYGGCEGLPAHLGIPGASVLFLASATFPVLATAHHIGILAVALLMAAAMIAAVLHRLRIRRPLLIVRTGPLQGIPLSPLLFLSLVAIGLTAAWITDHPVHPIVALGYPAIGSCWFAALWNIHLTIITEYGIVPDVHRMDTAVPWGRVVDYSISPTDDGGAHFMFLHRTDGPSAPARLDVHVPVSQYATMEAIVRQKLDARFMLAVQSAYRPHPSEQ